jgi:hypothetical protein
MKTKAICHGVACDSSVGERPRYYARQLITADEMTLEQEYFRSKLRLHNRFLHGWGVVCGAEVCPVPTTDKKTSGGYEAWKVIVKPGYALDCCGNEINIDCCRIVDLRTEGVTVMTGDPCVQEQDPLYVAVKYKAMMTRPVRVQPVGCGCDDNACEYSRWRDGYEISIITYCPDSHSNPPNAEDLMKCDIPKCPECSDDAWVVLAKVEVDENGKIKQIDNCVCRRMVKSFANFWWKCTPNLPEITDVTPETVEPGQQNVEVTITGDKFVNGLQVDFGQGIRVTHVDVKSRSEITVTINVANNVATGPHTVTVINPDCSTATKADAFSINKTPSLPPPAETPSREEPSRRPRRGGREARRPE